MSNAIEENIKNKRIKRRFNGVVISDKMEKTIVVRVDSIKVHPKYKKRHFVSQKYKVHDERGQYHDGDKVIFIECRPLSKEKRWRVLYDTRK